MKSARKDWWSYNKFDLCVDRLWSVEVWEVHLIDPPVDILDTGVAPRETQNNPTLKAKVSSIEQKKDFYNGRMSIAYISKF